METQQPVSLPKGEIPEWSQEHSGIGLESLLFQLDYCINKRRMTLSDAERFLKHIIMCNDHSTLRLKSPPSMHNFISITYERINEEGFGEREGFTLPSSNIYLMLVRVRNQREEMNNVFKKS